MKEHLKRALATLYKNSLEDRIEHVDLFTDVAVRNYHDEGKFNHPSLIVAAEKANPIEPEEAGIYTIELHFRMTTPMDVPEGGAPIDPIRLHTQRVASMEENIDFLVHHPPESNELEIMHIEHGEQESQSSSEARLYSDIQSVSIIAQVR